MLIRHHANLSKTFKIKELIISESRNYCPSIQERLSIHFWHWLEFKRFFQKSVIFLINWVVPPTSHQTEGNSKNITAYNFWFAWPVSKRLRNLFLYILQFWYWLNSRITFQKSVILSIIWGVHLTSRQHK